MSDIPTEFTIIHTNNWNDNSSKIKEVIRHHNLIWNSEKILKEVSLEEIQNIYKKYKIEDLFDNNLEETGSVGYYEALFGKLKVVKITNNILLIYKELYSNEFHINFIKTCRDLGCTIIKIIDDEVVFRNKLNIELTNLLNSKEGEKNVRTKNFTNKIELLKEEFKEQYSQQFINKWKNCLKLITTKEK